MYVNQNNYETKDFHEKLSIRQIFSNYIFCDDNFLSCLAVEFPFSTISRSGDIIQISTESSPENINDRIVSAIKQCISLYDYDHLREIKKDITNKINVSSCAFNSYIINGTIFIHC